MSLTTFSTFYFDYEVTRDNLYLNFAEGAGPELTAEIQVGSYTFSTLATAIKTALDIAGALTYTVIANRNDRTYTISSTSNFSLLVSTGTATDNIFSTIGFTGPDRTGASTYTGLTAGKSYEPQFILQDHISSDNSRKAVEATVRKTTNGRIEVVKFGVEKFVQLNIKFANNLAQDGRVIKNNPQGIEDLQEFMQFLITKSPIEFMPDIDNKSTFEKLLLESTPSDRDGIGYELRELYDRNLPNYFETGILRFRVVE
jgi:hypothetical protein